MTNEREANATTNRKRANKTRRRAEEGSSGLRRAKRRAGSSSADPKLALRRPDHGLDRAEERRLARIATRLSYFSHSNDFEVLVRFGPHLYFLLAYTCQPAFLG